LFLVPGEAVTDISAIVDLRGNVTMTSPAAQQAEGLTFAAYPGDGAVLLAFDVDQGLEPDLAGFAVEYTDPDGQTRPVLNRLGFTQAITSATTPEQRQFIPTSLRNSAVIAGRTGWRLVGFMTWGFVPAGPGA
jgi:hypothetical protein